MYKLKRVLYGLKQAPRAWYDRLTAYLTEHGFRRGSADTTNDSLAHYFADEMKVMFEMSMVGELTYFLGLQVK